MPELERNGHLAEAIVETIAQPLLVLDADLRIELVNRAFLQHFQVAPEETKGRYVYDIGNRQWDIPELHRLLEEVLSENGNIEDYRVEHTFENVGDRIMLLNARRLLREDRPELILLAISDITERERLRFELEGQREFGEKLIDSVREALLVLGWDLRVHSANQSFYDTFEVTPEETEGRLIYELGNGQWNVPELRTLLEDILPRETAFDDYEVVHDFESIGRRAMMLNARRLDHMNLILVAIRDVTAAREAETRQSVLVGELHHRVKNILNNVQTLASQTRRRSRDLDQFAEAFEARLGALARTQDLLLQSPAREVGLRNILRLELEAVGAEEGAQYRTEGPVVRLSPHDGQAIAMTVHELTTNAAKYGALATPGGRIDIGWRIEERNDQPHLQLEWRERGVAIGNTNPPKGFGTRVIEETLPHMLGGTVELKLEPDGAVCRVDCPLQR